VTTPMPLFRMRSDESRRAWLEGWLNAYSFVADAMVNDRTTRETEILAASFKSQLKEMIDREKERENR